MKINFIVIVLLLIQLLTASTNKSKFYTQKKISHKEAFQDKVIYFFKKPVSDLNVLIFKDMLKSAFGVLAFLNQTILRNTKEDTVIKGGVITILIANLKHKFRTKFGYELKLQNPNDTLPFPLPNRWSHPDDKMSMQQIYMIIKQIGLNLKKAGKSQRELIDKNLDRSQSAIIVMGLLNTVRLQEMEVIEKIRKEYNVLSEVKYTQERELIFADSIVNGQHSYLLRKYGNQHFEVKGSKRIDEKYRKAIEQSFRNEVCNHNASVFNLTREEILRRIKNSQGVYTMMFENLQEVSNGDVLKHKPEIYIDNEALDEMHYLHVPYPVFLRVNGNQGQTRYICVAIGTRSKGQPRIFSPFFANQGERVWRLAQSHLASTILIDFSVRVHLGVYHFTTNQYHVPIYKFLNNSKGNRAETFKGFLDHTYSLFSRGLEGVNVAATASLVHPIPKYSLVNKVFNLESNNAVKVIADTSNNIKIFQYDPITILKKQGIERQQVEQYFDKLNFDFQLYDILSKYIEDIYNAFKVQDYADQLLTQINQQAKNMAVGSSTPRPSLRDTNDVLTTIKNLSFCWVGFHSHTFSTISLATYAHFRPSMLKTQIPQNSRHWENIQVGEELPDSKIIMQTGKLNEATTQRDSDNFLLDNIRRQYEIAAYNVNKYDRNPILKQAYTKVQKSAKDTLQKLRQYEQRVVAKNKQRKNQEGSIVFEWMVPSKIQSSLNI